MKKKLINIFKKLHRWPGLIISFFLLYYGITGIFMNHREYFSSLDISRSYLPQEYQFKNWNNASIKGNIEIGKDSVLVYGNLGVYLCDSNFQNFIDFNAGFPKGIDNRKVFDLHITTNNDLYSSNQFGFYSYDWNLSKWTKIDINDETNVFVAIESRDDSIYLLSRSHLYKAKSESINTKFSKVNVEKPIGANNKVSLFKTFWQIHSGEIFGNIGKLFVDFLGIITVIISITGIIYFVFPSIIKARKKQLKKFDKLKFIKNWSLDWHNKLGAYLFLFLTILYATGIFLRPPVLIAIADSYIDPIKYTHLDQNNYWYDKFRDLKYDSEIDNFLIASSEGLLRSNNDFSETKFIENQPPISVMGINVLENYKDGWYLVGSFSGLFLWNPNSSIIYNFPLGKKHQQVSSIGPPIGDFKVSGLIKDKDDNLFMLDYDLGAIALHHNNKLNSMPEEIVKKSKISLWNLSLEIHTGRIFNFLMSSFYILIVPLSGIISVIVTISGYLLWKKKYN